MNIEFHYYITHYLAKKAGFSPEDAQTLAYGSQFTDDNRAILTIMGEDGTKYINFKCQTMDITAPARDLMRVYLCFHFLPGDYETKSAYRKDGKLHLLNTTPNSENAKLMMAEALKEKDLFRLSIATHTFADTWAHQNFIGTCDAVNASYSLAAKILPNIGHADALHNPDMVSLLWEDKRLIPSHAKINNNERMLEAAKEIYGWFKKYLNPQVGDNEISSEWPAIEATIEKAMGDIFTERDEYETKRLENYKNILGESTTYDKEAWLDEAVNRKVRGLRDRTPGLLNKPIFPDALSMKPDFYESKWYKFQQAVKMHQKFVRSILLPRFEKMEIENF